MKTRYVVLVALIAAVPLASVAAAGPGAAKQRVAISAKNLSTGQFVLTPLQSGALKRDSGAARIDFSEAGQALRQGQSVSLYDTTFTYKGKRGTLTIRERIGPMCRTRTLTASTSARVSRSAPGRSSVGPVSTPGSLEAGGPPCRDGSEVVRSQRCFVTRR